jgi:hypothetical protein
MRAGYDYYLLGRGALLVDASKNSSRNRGSTIRIRASEISESYFYGWVLKMSQWH